VKGHAKQMKGGASKQTAFNKMLSIVKGRLNDTGITNGEQLDRYARRYFPTQYKGILTDVDDSNIQQYIHSLGRNQFYILNKDMHWTALVNRSGKVKEYDSYNRDLLKQIPELKIQTAEDIQGASGIDDKSCGQRVLAKMHIIFN